MMNKGGEMSRAGKKTVFVILTVLLVISGIYTVYAGKTSLNKRQITVFVGASCTLKLKGTTKKVKWSSADPKIAFVSEKGIVTGKKAGKTFITVAVSGGGKYKCAVNVRRYLYKRAVTPLSAKRILERRGEEIGVIPAKLYYKKGELIVEGYFMNLEEDSTGYYAVTRMKNATIRIRGEKQDGENILLTARKYFLMELNLPGNGYQYIKLVFPKKYLRCGKAFHEEPESLKNVEIELVNAFFQHYAEAEDDEKQNAVKN